MSLSKEKQALLNALLKYVEGAASKYYRRHRKLFEEDTFSLDDLKQEAKIVCLSVFKKYHKMHEVNGFDLKKFVSRAVGWKLRDLMNCAITESLYFTHSLNNVEQDEDVWSPLDAENAVDKNYNLYDTLPPELQYGFNVKDIFSQFSGVELAILKHMIRGKSDRNVMSKELKKVSPSTIKTLWHKRIYPKVRLLLLAQQKEL